MPTFAYQVSGEYSMIMAAVQNGWLDRRARHAGKPHGLQARRRGRGADLFRPDGGGETEKPHLGVLSVRPEYSYRGTGLCPIISAVVSSGCRTMTFGDKAEERRAKVGTKVLAFGFAIFAVLGSFWTIVWFIRSYVEPPRVTISPALALASLDSKPVPPPAPTAAPEPTGSISQPKPAVSPATAEAVRPAPVHGTGARRPSRQRGRFDCGPVGTDDVVLPRLSLLPPLRRNLRQRQPRPPRHQPSRRLTKSPKARSRPLPARLRCRGPNRCRPPPCAPAPPNRRCRARAPTARRRRACGPPSQRPTTATRRGSNHSSAAPESIRCGR